MSEILLESGFEFCKTRGAKKYHIRYKLGDLVTYCGRELEEGVALYSTILSADEVEICGNCMRMYREDINCGAKDESF